MSYTINTGVVTGNITKDADIRTTNSGKTIAKFSIAVNRSQKNQAGEWEKVPSFFDVVHFCHPGLAPLLVRGTSVAVQYELRQDRWQDKETGANRSKVELFAHEVLLIGGKKDGQQHPDQDNAPADVDCSQIPF